jgi:hypothetical protein
MDTLSFGQTILVDKWVEYKMIVRMGASFQCFHQTMAKKSQLPKKKKKSLGQVKAL